MAPSSSSRLQTALYHFCAILALAADHYRISLLLLLLFISVQSLAQISQLLQLLLMVMVMTMPMALVMVMVVVVVLAVTTNQNGSVHSQGVRRQRRGTLAHISLSSCLSALLSVGDNSIKWKVETPFCCFCCFCSQAPVETVCLLLLTSTTKL